MTNDKKEKTASGRRRTLLHLVAELGDLRTRPSKAAGPGLFCRGRADGENRKTAFFLTPCYPAGARGKKLPERPGPGIRRRVFRLFYKR
ncbi:hypothetical protein D4R89_12370 [bacterium]|nr:MAG: hypothetical protein D4R89_12370 [bacterium]